MRALPTLGAIPAITAHLLVDDVVVAAVLYWVSALAILACAFLDQNTVIGRLRSSSWYHQDENGMDTELRPDAVSLFRGSWVLLAVLLGIFGYVELA